MKRKVHKLGADKLVPVPVDLNKLSDVVKHDVVKITEYDDLVKKPNAIQTTNTSNLTVCSCHVTYAFQSESTLYICLNVKELLVRSSSEIWSLSDCNWARTQNPLVRNRTLNHLPKLTSDWDVFWVLICTVHLIVYSCNVTYAFQSESTLCSCLNIQELPAWSRCEI